MTIMYLFLKQKTGFFKVHSFSITEKIQDWKNEKNKVTTSLGKSILKRVLQERFEVNK